MHSEFLLSCLSIIILMLCSCAGPQPGGNLAAPEPPTDRGTAPFKRVVIMGESTVRGGGWVARQEDRYADVLVRLINEVQAEPVEYFNKGIGANAISPRSPGYPESRKPSAMERYKDDVIANRPDLFIMAYGLNDMRAGMDVNTFIEEMETIIRDVRSACDPLIVLVSVYHMPRYDYFPPYNKGSVEATLRYNNAIRRLAERTGCLFADVYSAQARANWLVHEDSVHANKVGNLVIAHEIFRVLATHCSGLSKAVNKGNANTEWTRAIRSTDYGRARPQK
jgi:lysophospholipase L1-like esterase